MRTQANGGAGLGRHSSQLLVLHVFPISNRVTDQVIMINSVFTIIINNIIISITVIFAVFIADEEDEGREAYLCAS